MAVCKIWSVKNNLSRVIEYVANDEKVSEDIYTELHKELNYISNNSKTEQKLYVSGINCEPSNAKEEFTLVKKRFNKEKGIIAFHAIQSFAEGEVTPEVAHEIGLQLATEMWGNKFQVVVATHLNTKHLHNHFIINSVSMIDGKRYYDTRTSYAELRKLNDQICMEHNLSFMEEKKTKSGINYYNYQLKDNNYSKQTKKDIDLAIGISSSYSEFINVLENMNYEVYVRANKLSVRSLDYNRNIRIERRYGKDYSIENIKKRILGLYLPENKKYYKSYFQRDNILDNLIKMNCKGLAKHYIKYLKLLNNYPKYVKKNRVSYEMKKEIEKMDSISKQTILLAKNNITNEEELIKLYMDLKKELYNNSNDEEIKEKIELINEIRNRKELLNIENEKEVMIR